MIRGLSLFARVFLFDAVVPGVAAVLPAMGLFTISVPVRLSELLALLVGLVAMLW